MHSLASHLMDGSSGGTGSGRTGDWDSILAHGPVVVITVLSSCSIRGLALQLLVVAGGSGGIGHRQRQGCRSVSFDVDNERDRRDEAAIRAYRFGIVE